MHLWKIPNMVKGALTWVPPLNALRVRRAGTGGAGSARYCYSVCLRHLRILESQGFQIKGAKIGELGPGDSLGFGLAALLAGAKSYVGLDVVPFSKNSDLLKILEELTALFSASHAVPNEEFPGVRPKLVDYAFPTHLVDRSGLSDKARKIRAELEAETLCGQLVTYRAPWTALTDVTQETLDLIFSQAVLEHVDLLPETYRAMFAWLKPGGYASHVIDFGAHHVSPFWNGHWAYSDWQWKIVRGRREFLLNREPMSRHLSIVRSVGFEVMMLRHDYDDHGLGVQHLSRNRRTWDAEDRRTRGIVLVLRKPAKA